MQLLERYLQAVKKYLPLARQEDIAAELSANILAQVEDQERELGRPLTEAEQRTLIQQHGHPVLVASRYLPQRYLISPAIFPVYWLTLKTVLPWVVILYAIANTFALVLRSNPPSTAEIIGKILGVFGVLLTTAVWMTLAFGIGEYVLERNRETLPNLDKWDPSTLPPVKTAPRKPVNYQAGLEVLVQCAFLLWVLCIPSHPYLLFGPGAVPLERLPLQLAPMWHTFYGWLVILICLQLALKVVVLFFRREGVRKIADAIGAIGGCALVAFLCANGPYLLLKEQSRGNAASEQMARHANDGIFLALKLALAVSVLQLVWKFGRSLISKFAGSSRKTASEIISQHGE